MDCCSKHGHGDSQKPSEPPKMIKMAVIAVFAVGGGYYLWTQHKAHVLQFLPFIIFLLCPLMHLFHGHGNHEAGHAHDQNGGREKDPDPSPQRK